MRVGEKTGARAHHSGRPYSGHIYEEIDTKQVERLKQLGYTAARLVASGLFHQAAFHYPADGDTPERKGFIITYDPVALVEQALAAPPPAKQIESRAA